MINEDWKWTEDEDEESSDLENGPKTKTKILRNFEKSSKIGISSKIFEEPKIFRRIERKMRNLKSMFCEKNSDEIDHYKNFGHQKFFSFSIQKINPFSSIFPQNFFNKRWFFLKIFEIFGLKSSKLRRFFDFWKWAEDEDEDGSSAKNLRRTKIFEASMQHWYV